jgi:hypothetical protein
VRRGYKRTPLYDLANIAIRDAIKVGQSDTEKRIGGPFHVIGLIFNQRL